MKKNLLLNTWSDYIYQIGNSILLNEHIEYALKNFWLEIVDRLEEGYFIRIQFKLKGVNNEYRSISYLQTANKGDLDQLIEIFQQFWNLRKEDYQQEPVQSIVFTYKVVLKEGSVGESKLVRHKKVQFKQTTPFRFKGFNLPTTMDITKWSGQVQFNEDFTSAIVYINKTSLEYHVTLFDKHQIVKVMVGKNILFEFTDTVNNVFDLSCFTRQIKTQLYIFINGELIIKQINRKANFLAKIETDSVVSNKFITMDLETRNLNGKLEPFCVSTYLLDQDGTERAASYYLKDYNSPEHMLSYALNSLLESRFNGYKVYLHNFSGFDSIFLIRILSELSSKITPIIRDSKIINLAVKYGYKNENTIHFRDSLLLLPKSLKELAIDFNIEFNKGIFPYKFVENPEVKLNYVGKIPNINYFEGISVEQYKEYCATKLNWDLAYETKFYCELDCKVLYLIIKTFSSQIYNLFKLDILNYTTLPSLSMAIYRSNFLQDNYKIPLIDGVIYNDLKKAYTGGMVDVYKPTNEPNNKVHSYDVNSLYPFTMFDSPMPVGNPKFFEGNIFKIDPNAFGVFEVEVKAPDNLKYPVLQTKVQINGNNTTIAPLGNWTGWYFSAEIYNAMKFGYTIKVLRGYLFEKGNIFIDFVQAIYKLKANSIPGTPSYTIAKFILNSLSGKFGTDPNFDKHVIVDSIKANNYYNKYVVTNVIDLGNNKSIISFFNKNSKKEINKPTSNNTSIPIALAITSYGRIHMSWLKKLAQELGLTIFYMDTDCVALSGELDSTYVGKELGKLKLEHVFNEVIYLAPKVYGGKTDTYEITKVKGLKNQIKFEDLKPLLKKKSKLSLDQQKMYKYIGEGFISVKNEVYTLMITENKRELIFNSNQIFIDTKPYVLHNGELIKS